MSKIFEFEYNVLQEMLIVNHQEGFSYNMCYEDDVFSVTTKLNEQQDTIQSLKEENEQLKKRLRKCANNWKQEIVERGKLEEEIEQLKQKLENLDLNEKNDTSKMKMLQNQL